MKQKTLNTTILILLALILTSLYFFFPKKYKHDSVSLVATAFGMNLDTKQGWYGRIYTKVVVEEEGGGTMTAVPSNLYNNSKIWDYVTRDDDGYILHEGKCIMETIGIDHIPYPSIWRLVESTGYSSNGQILSVLKDGEGTLIFDIPFEKQRHELDYESTHLSDSSRVYEMP